jgi:hypothetical protein
MVSNRVAKTNKSHIVVEDIILPAAEDMAWEMLGEKAKQTMQTGFIKQHCFTTYH